MGITSRASFRPGGFKPRGGYLSSQRLLDAFPIAADEANVFRGNVVAGLTRFDEFAGDAVDVLIDFGQLAFQRAGIFIRRLRRLARMAFLAAATEHG